MKIHQQLGLLSILLLLSTSACGKQATQENTKDTQMTETSLVKPQGTIIPFNSDKWEVAGSAKFEDYLGQKAVHLGIKEQGQYINYGQALLKKMNFSNGIIEYDIAFDDKQNYPGINFRQQGQGDFERFYMRPHESGSADANSYIPLYNGIQSWQLYYGPQFSSNKEYVFNQWQHIKLVINNNVADIFINDMEKPELTVELKHDNKSGTISLYGLNVAGDVRFANFAVKHIDNPQIIGTPVSEKAAESGILLSWSISDSFAEKLLLGKTTIKDEFKYLKYTKLKSDATGITNLAKVQGIDDEKDTVFAKIVINSDTSQIKKMDFGFANKVKVYLNGNLLFEGDDNFQSRDEIFLGTMGFYDSLHLHMEQGENEVLLAITENRALKGGWGVQAKFDDMKNISFVE